MTMRRSASSAGELVAVIKAPVAISLIHRPASLEKRLAASSLLRFSDK
jgi:hypothetical protein